MTSTEGPALALHAVEKAYATAAGPVTVLQGVDLAVAHGEVVAIGGRSGSGKTTMLTLIGGFERPDAGRVEVLGETVVMGGTDWATVALLPQSLGLLEELTVAENIALPLRLAERTAPRHPAELMEHLGLTHLADRQPDEISLGEQQRTALARAAVLGPAVLLADEPISHQNDAWAQTMLLVLRQLAEAGTACLLATHNALAFDAAHQVWELEDGRLHRRSPG